jgi:Zn-dependent M28 family amino/carboxypeptidase
MKVPSPNTEGGILFSAQYDSGSTAPGMSDDAKGIATLLQLTQFFAEHRVKRTAIFNIYNGEEVWLNGAHVYVTLFCCLPAHN